MEPGVEMVSRRRRQATLLPGTERLVQDVKWHQLLTWQNGRQTGGSVSGGKQRRTLFWEGKKPSIHAQPGGLGTLPEQTGI